MFLLFPFVTTSCADDTTEPDREERIGCPTAEEKKQCNDLIDEKEYQQILERAASGCVINEDCTRSGPCDIHVVNKANLKQYYSELAQLPRSQCLSQYKDCISLFMPPLCPTDEIKSSPRCFEGRCVVAARN